MPNLSPLRADPVAFATKLLKNPDGTPFVPHPAQMEILRGIRRDTTLVAGRQFGKSVVLGADGAWYAATHANRQVYCFGPTLDQARIIFNEMARHFKTAPLSALLDGKVREFPFPYFKLANGTEVHGRGANSPQYIRGHHAHRAYCDEAAFFKEGVIGDVIEPMFLVTGKEPDSALVLTSTPFGQGEFFEAVELAKRDPGRAAFHYTSYDNPHADTAFLDRQRARYGEDSLRWRTEYLGLFADSDLAVFPWPDVKWAYEHYPHEEGGKHLFPAPPARGHRYVQGVDLANRRDYFVAAVLDVTNPLLAVHVHADRHQQKTYALYKELVRGNHAAFHGARTLIDATTLAESVVEDLADIGAEGYAFTGSAAKYAVVQELGRMFSEHRLALPYERALIDELRYFEYDITPAKVVRMEARRGHDDWVMALALAAHLAVVPDDLGFFAPVSFTPKAPEKPKATPGLDHYDPFAELFIDDEDLA